jgi:DNA primase
MSSSAKPLWMPLPDGALKRQLLIEIADLVQLASRELLELWTSQASANAERAKRNHSLNSAVLRPQFRGRPIPASRADHATRLLLSNMAALDDLSAEDHSMLCELPVPHGPLFAWLEQQLHEHGAQPWAALREGLRGQPQEDIAVRLMSGYELSDTDDVPSSLSELRDLLNRMLIERLKVQETATIHDAKTDPTALHRYREFQTRRRQLEAALLVTTD